MPSSGESDATGDGKNNFIRTHSRAHHKRALFHRASLFSVVLSFLLHVVFRLTRSSLARPQCLEMMRQGLCEEDDAGVLAVILDHMGPLEAQWMEREAPTLWDHVGHLLEHTMDQLIDMVFISRIALTLTHF